MRVDSLTQQTHSLLHEHVRPGDFVIDATAGNGHDTVLLAELVGDSGGAFAFDNQRQAIESTKRHLEQAGLLHRVTCFCEGHEFMGQYIPVPLHGRISTIVFNLGYLPGSDKSHITRQESTLAALSQAMDLLTPNGMISIIAYTGHHGGREEAEGIKQWAESLTNIKIKTTVPLSKNNNAPEWIEVTYIKRPE